MSAETVEETTEVAFDLSAFEAALSVAVETDNLVKSDDVLVVSEPNIEAVRVAYQALEGIKAKNAARKSLNDQARDAVMAREIDKARGLMQLAESATVATKAPAAPKEPVDPTEGYVTRVAALNLAYNFATASQPDNVNADWSDKVSAKVAELNADFVTLRDWDGEGDMPEVDALVAASFKLANRQSFGGVRTTTSTSTGPRYEGERRDVAAHIINAFSQVDSGTFLTVAEIRSTPSEEYGSDAPSPGAISARLFPSSGKPCNVEGIEAGRNDDGKKGARKL